MAFYCQSGNFSARPGAMIALQHELPKFSPSQAARKQASEGPGALQWANATGAFLTASQRLPHKKSRIKRLSEFVHSFSVLVSNHASFVDEQIQSAILCPDSYAKLLSRAIDASLKGCDQDSDTFRNRTAAELRANIDRLKQKAAEDLTLQVHQAADEADTFTGELNTHQTLAVKQVMDAVDVMIRNRRRRLRWLKRIGFGLLEWLVLGIMWCVWFVVVALRSARSLATGIVRGIRWVVWAS